MRDALYHLERSKPASLQAQIREILIDDVPDLESVIIGIADEIELSVFADEVEGWIIDELKKVGLDSAKSVLAVSKEDLERRTDLEKESIEELYSILSREFED